MIRSTPVRPDESGEYGQQTHPAHQHGENKDDFAGVGQSGGEIQAQTDSTESRNDFEKNIQKILFAAFKQADQKSGQADGGNGQRDDGQRFVDSFPADLPVHEFQFEFSPDGIEIMQSGNGESSGLDPSTSWGGRGADPHQQHGDQDGSNLQFCHIDSVEARGSGRNWSKKWKNDFSCPAGVFPKGMVVFRQQESNRAGKQQEQSSPNDNISLYMNESGKVFVRLSINDLLVSGDELHLEVLVHIDHDGKTQPTQYD